MSASDKRTKKNKKTMPCPDSDLLSMLELFNVPAGQNNELLIGKFILDNCALPAKIDNWGNIIIRKGNAETFPVFVCHIDTVHDYEEGFEAYLLGRDIVAADANGYQVGCGGDDKCGVWTCLELLKRLDNVLCVFFSKEEGGGEGSSNIDMKIFEGARFVAGIDRWGNSDIINDYMGDNTTSQAFCKDVKHIRKMFNYKYQYGMFTDSMNLFDRDIGIVCINVSCGYYMHHTDNEIVNVDELFTALMFCLHLADLNKVYSHKKPKRKITRYNYNLKYDHNKHSVYEKGSADRYCKECGILLWEREIDICIRCEESVEICETCGVILQYTDERAAKQCFPCQRETHNQHVDY